MGLTFKVPMPCYSLQHQLYFHHQIHPQLGVVSPIAQPVHPFWIISLLFSSRILGSADLRTIQKDPNYSNRKVLELISELGNIAGYKINTQKVAFEKVRKRN